MDIGSERIIAIAREIMEDANLNDDPAWKYLVDSVKKPGTKEERLEFPSEYYDAQKHKLVINNENGRCLAQIYAEAKVSIPIPSSKFNFTDDVGLFNRPTWGTLRNIPIMHGSTEG